MNGTCIIAEDDRSYRRRLKKLMEEHLSVRAMEAEHGGQALQILNDKKGPEIDFLCLDLEMPVMDAMKTLQRTAADFPHIPVFMLTGQDSALSAVQAMKFGAKDYFLKDLPPPSLVERFKRILSEQGSVQNGFDSLIGYQGGLADAVKAARHAAGSDIPVMITGETGTGKEVVAKALHNESARASGPFVPVNCGAIPPQLIESTLFGHEKGAFTGATEKAPGKFRQAHGGTIFLDEIGELPLEAQTRFLRVLQENEIEPVGAGKPEPVNVRVIAATHKDLKDEVRQGHFREDLLYRLEVFDIPLPPLRDRKQDIEDLARYFIGKYEAVMPDNEDAIFHQLLNYAWPGNVRELEHCIYKAAVLKNWDAALSELHVKTPKALKHNDALGTTHLDLLNDQGTFKTMSDLEQDIFTRALSRHDGNMTLTARTLGIAKSTLYRKIFKAD